MCKLRISVAVAALVLLSGIGQGFAQVVEVDADIPTYSKVSGVSGNIDSVGSDTMNNLMTLWCQKFNEYYPNVRCQIEGKGSSTRTTGINRRCFPVWSHVKKDEKQRNRRV